MTIKKIQEIINADRERRETILKYKKYYDNQNEILKKGIVPADKDPIRNADNRIPHNFHTIMVDEKAGYMFTYPVLFDLGNKELNDKIIELLGDDFESIAQGLCIEASNTGKAWLHYWIDTDTSNFAYGIVEDEQIIAIYDITLKRKLIKILRYYEIAEENDKGKILHYIYFEEWEQGKCTVYKFSGELNRTDFKYIDEYTFNYAMGNIPFIKFTNNWNEKSDLDKYKQLIDLYDRVMSGFANDLEDIQQIIYILENYGGEDLNEFLQDLKRFKAIKTESNVEDKSKGDVRTLQIEIPTEARKVLLEILKKQIYESGQALQQDSEGFGNASGVALKFFYRKLELKAGMMETQFKKGWAELIRAILEYLELDTTVKINQTWTRNMISNDYENAQIAQLSTGIISQKTLLKHHPWVEDPNEEIKEVEEEQKQYNFSENTDNKKEVGEVGEE